MVAIAHGTGFNAWKRIEKCYELLDAEAKASLKQR
jgi:hypothetical protein